MEEFFKLLFHFDKQKLFIEPTENIFVQVFRFSFVGIIATLFDVATTAVFREIISFNDIYSSACGFVIGLIINYLLSTFWVFNSKNTNRVREFTIFTIIGLIGLLINMTIIYLFGKILNLDYLIFNKLALFYIIKALAILIAFIWNFTARKYILYKK